LLGFHPFLNETFRNLRDLHRFETYWWFSTKGRWSSSITWVLVGDLRQNLRKPLNLDSVFVDLVAGSRKRIGNFLFSFFTGSELSNFFPSSSPTLPLWSCRIHCFWRWIWRLNCRDTVQWWWFSYESLRTAVNFIALCLNLDYGKLGFSSCSWAFLSLLWFWS